MTDARPDPFSGGRPKGGDAQSAFDRGYVAMSYLLDRRGPDLLFSLGAPAAAAVELARRLGHAERALRAQALAPELARFAAALEARRFR